LEPTYASWSGDLGTTNLASGSFFATADQDNTQDRFNRVELKVALSGFGATPNDSGQVVVRLQSEGDGTADWPDDGNGPEVLVFDPDTTGTFRKTTLV